MDSGENPFFMHVYPGGGIYGERKEQVLKAKEKRERFKVLWKGVLVRLKEPGKDEQERIPQESWRRRGRRGHDRLRIGRRRQGRYDPPA